MSIHNRLPEASRVLTFFRPYEIAVIERLSAGVIAPEVLQAVIRDGEFVEYDYTGYGYYLTYRHELLPSERIVCSELGIVASGRGGRSRSRVRAVFGRQRVDVRVLSDQRRTADSAGLSRSAGDPSLKVLPPLNMLEQLGILRAKQNSK